MNKQAKSAAKSTPAQTLLGTPAVLLSAPAAVTLQSSQIERSMSVIFSPPLIVDLQGDGALCATQVVSLNAPVRLPEKGILIGYLNSVVLSVSKSPGVRVLVTVDLAGAAKSWEFDYDFPEAEPATITTRHERIFSPQGLELASDLGIGLSKPGDYYATLTITAQRRNEREFVLATIDTLDVSAYLAS